MKKFVQSAVAVLFLTGGLAMAQTSGEIRGRITNTEKEVVPFATVRILQDDHLVSGAQSDEEGVYSCKPLEPGTYNMVVSEAGHITQPVRKIKVIPNEPTKVNVVMQINSLATVTVIAKPIDHAGFAETICTFRSVDGEELRTLAAYTSGDIEGALEAVTSEVISGPGGEVHFRGARGGAAGFFVDGVRTLNPASVPGSAIENLTVLTGGVPAMYGDVTSGLVIITTKSYFSGIREKNIRNAERREAEAAEKVMKMDE